MVDVKAKTPASEIEKSHLDPLHTYHKVVRCVIENDGERSLDDLFFNSFFKPILNLLFCVSYLLHVCVRMRGEVKDLGTKSAHLASGGLYVGIRHVSSHPETCSLNAAASLYSMMPFPSWQGCSLG